MLISAWRLALLVMARIAASVAEALRRETVKIDIRREGLNKLSVRPISHILAPQVDIASDDPVEAIVASPEFKNVTAFFSDNPVTSRSLVSPDAQALLYCLVRNLKPKHVFEIGAYRAGTTEALCRGLYANGNGMVHAVDPFCGEQMTAVLGRWPQALLHHVKLYAMDSMAFFKEMERRKIHPGLVFVDGNHDYEFALFDIGCGARAIMPGGFIFIDNVAQVGPFFAGRDFLSTNPGWREIGSSARDYNPDKAYDRDRTTIHNTDFMVLRAPRNYQVDDRPRNFGLIRWPRNRVNGVHLKLCAPAQPAELDVQVVFRGFGALPIEIMAETKVQVAQGVDSLSVALKPPALLEGEYIYFTVEPWLVWHGTEPLQLVQPPEPY